MSFASILSLIQTRILSEATDPYWTQKSIEKPTAVIPWENNPTQWNEEDYPQPLRPYVAVEFGDLPLTLAEGRKGGQTEINIKVVIDNFRQGRDDSPDKSDYLTALRYGDHIEELLDNYARMETLGISRPLFHQNVIIFTIRVKLEVYTLRGRNPWTAPAPPAEPEP